MASVYRETGVRFEATYKDYSGAKSNPVNPQMVLRRPSGETEITITPDHDDTGEYHHDFNFNSTHPTGEWNVIWSGTIGGLDITEVDEIFVKERKK